MDRNNRLIQSFYYKELLYKRRIAGRYKIMAKAVNKLNPDRILEKRQNNAWLKSDAEFRETELACQRLLSEIRRKRADIHKNYNAAAEAGEQLEQLFNA